MSEQDHQDAEAQKESEQCFIRLRNWREESSIAQETYSPAKFLNNKTLSSGKQPESPLKRPESPSKRPESPNKRPEEPRQDTGYTNQSIGDINESDGLESARSNLDEVPRQTKFFNPSQRDFNMIIQHSEAVLSVRRHLISEAIRAFPSMLTETCMRELQQAMHQKQKALERRFDDYLLQTQGYGSGEAFEDRNMKILYKTFLQAEVRKSAQTTLTMKSMH